MPNKLSLHFSEAPCTQEGNPRVRCNRCQRILSVSAAYTRHNCRPVAPERATAQHTSTEQLLQATAGNSEEQAAQQPAGHEQHEVVACSEDVAGNDVTLNGSRVDEALFVSPPREDLEGVPADDPYRLEQEALDDEVRRRMEDVHRLDINYERDATAVSGAEGRAWLDVADQPVSIVGGHVVVKDTVRQVAFDLLEMLHRYSMSFAAMEEWIRVHSRQHNGPPSPSNPANRYPPSLYVCRLLVGVPDLARYERHLCPAGCLHCFPSLANWRQHIGCQGCDLCVCSCGERRFTQDGQPACRAYFFDDAFQTFFLDKTWADRVLPDWHARSAPFFTSAQCQRLDAKLGGSCPVFKRVYWDVASDGVEMRNFTPHGTQLFLLRCASAPTDLRATSSNVRLLMAVPGPKAPKNYRPFWNLVLDMFAKHGPAGRPLLLEVAGRTGADRYTEMIPILFHVVADYIMRCHITKWYQPTASHPGGWCSCSVRGWADRCDVEIGGYTLSIPQPALGVGKQALACSDELKLSYHDIITMGNKAEAISAALALEPHRRDRALSRLRYKTMGQANGALKLLGRSGQAPWSLEPFLSALSYISPRDILPVPVAHTLLRGVLRDLLIFALCTNVTDVPRNHPIVFSAEARRKLQSMLAYILVPGGFNRAFRDPIQYIRSYVMEELCNLIWLGPILAWFAPPGFQELWRLLRPALEHYLYGFDATEAQMSAAALSLRRYAERLEMHVRRGEAPTKLVCSPNLHIAVCRLPEQERLSGPAALHAEWFMERYMVLPKKRSKYRTTHDPEITWLKHQEMTARGLQSSRQQHGCKSFRERHPSRERQGDGIDPGAENPDIVAFLFKGRAITARTRVFPTAYSAASVQAGAQEVVRQCAADNVPGWAGIDVQPASVWDVVTTTVYTKCRFRGFLAASFAAPQEGRTFGSSFVLADLRMEAAAFQPKICYVLWYCLLCRRGTADAVARFAAIQELQNCRLRDMMGTPYYQAEAPSPQATGRIRYVRVDKILAPLIVIKANPHIPSAANRDRETLCFLRFYKNSQMM